MQGIPPMSPLEMFNKQSMQISPQTTITQTSQLQQQLPQTHPLMMGTIERERHESASTDRESEIRRIFDPGILLHFTISKTQSY